MKLITSNLVQNFSMLILTVDFHVIGQRTLGRSDVLLTSDSLASTKFIVTLFQHTIAKCRVELMGFDNAEAILTMTNDRSLSRPPPVAVGHSLQCKFEFCGSLHVKQLSIKRSFCVTLTMQAHSRMRTPLDCLRRLPNSMARQIDSRIPRNVAIDE